MKKMSLEDVRLRALAEVAAAHIALRRRPAQNGEPPWAPPLERRPVLRLKYLAGEMPPERAASTEPY